MYNKNMTEIEKKYLLKEIPEDVKIISSHRIMQGYVALDVSGAEVRIRKRDNECTLTVKSAGGAQRLEAEESVSKEFFDKLWRMTDGRRISKTRHIIKLKSGEVCEADVYGEKLSGLLTAEVEFENMQDYDSFSPPDWFRKDVSEDDRYKNKNLAVYGAP